MAEIRLPFACTAELPEPFILDENNVNGKPVFHASAKYEKHVLSRRDKRSFKILLSFFKDKLRLNP